MFEDLPTNEEIILEVYPDNYVPAQDTEVTQNDPVVAQNNTELILDENNTVEVDPSLILDEEEKPTSDINLEKVEGTGLVTGQNKSSFNVPNLAFYIIGGVFIVAILVFFIMKTASKRKNIYDDYDDSHKEKIKVRKLSQIHLETKNTEGIRKEIAEAEEKLRRAQEQLNIVKNQDKIKEAEAKLERDRHELDELRRGRR